MWFLFYSIRLHFEFFKISKNTKNIWFFLILLTLVGVILTGERSNSLKALVGFFIFVSLIDYVKIKAKY